jgi:hypothetical protein
MKIGSYIWYGVMSRSWGNPGRWQTTRYRWPNMEPRLAWEACDGREEPMNWVSKVGETLKHKECFHTRAWIKRAKSPPQPWNHWTCLLKGLPTSCYHPNQLSSKAQFGRFSKNISSVKILAQNPLKALLPKADWQTRMLVMITSWEQKRRKEWESGIKS